MCTPEKADRSKRSAFAVCVALLCILAATFSGPPATAKAAAPTVVSLTFDDGWADQYQVRPILAARDMLATFYVMSGETGKAQRLTWAQLSTLAADGHEIGGHTLSHARLTSLSAAQMQREVCDDRAALVSRGFRVDTFAYPYGASNATAQSIVRNCGYAAGRGMNGLRRPVYAEPIPPLDPYFIRTPYSVTELTTLADLQSYVTLAENNGGGWVPLLFHRVCSTNCPVPNPNNLSGTISTSLLTQFLDWLAARNAQGTTVRTVADVMSPVQPPQPPPAPSGLAGTATSSTTINLTWTDNADNEAGYTVERSPDGTTWTVTTATLPAGATSYTDTGLNPATDHYYRVKATNAAGSSGYSNVVSVATPAGTATVFTETFPGPNGTAWNSSRWALNTGTTARLDVQSATGRMRFENVANARAQAIATMTKQANTEIVASFRFGSTSSASRGYLHVASRASGDWVSGYPRTSYFLQLTNDINNVQLWKSQSGTTTSLRSIAGMAAVTTAKQWIRFRIEGNIIRAKVWTDGSAEPANWELNVTDNSITGSGLLQLKWIRGGSSTTANNVFMDDITVTSLG